MRLSLLTPLFFLAAPAGLAQTVPGTPEVATAKPVTQAGAKVPDRYTLVEEFTADTLAAGEVQLGTDLGIGLTDKVMLGTDLVAATIGATTLEAKWAAYQIGEHKFAIGLRATYLNRDTLFWGAFGSIKDSYAALDARVVRPSISWTNTLSPRLKLHTFWAKGFGDVTARLSDKGRQDLWEAKHPGYDYNDRDPVTQAPRAPAAPNGKSTNTSSNQSKPASHSSPTQETIQVQSITGLAQERFQMTGEFNRASGNKVLMTCRVEQTTFEDLSSNFFRLTVAHQWIWPSFQMRLGVGAQYFVMNGKDLDGEDLAQAGWLPASDLAFYWRF